MVELKDMLNQLTCDDQNVFNQMENYLEILNEDGQERQVNMN